VVVHTGCHSLGRAKGASGVAARRSEVAGKGVFFRRSLGRPLAVSRYGPWAVSRGPRGVGGEAA